MSIPPVVASGLEAPPDGTLIEFEATARGDGVADVQASRSVEVQSAPALELSLDEDRDPVDPGSELEYTLSFGHVAAARVAPDAVLSMAVPAGTEFVSASEGGVLNGDTVEWSLGALDPGQGGERRLVVRVADDAAEGSSIKAEAEVRDADSPPAIARANAVTRVVTAPELLLDIDVSVNPQVPRALFTTLTVTNARAFPLTGLRLEARVPDGVESFAESLANGGSCNRIGSSAACERRESVIWELGALGSGESVSLSLAPPVTLGASTLPDGSVIEVFALAFDDSGAEAVATAAARFGEDGDADGFGDFKDNCPLVANADQADADRDGIGNACECGDANKDGFVNTTDARLIQRCVVGQITDPLICETLCDVTNDGVCNTTDARLIQRFAVGQLVKPNLTCAERP